MPFANGPPTAAGTAQALLTLFLGYAALLATPGPNMLAVGGIAAARGFARTLPLCLGIAAGVSSLAGAAGLLGAAGGAAGLIPGEGAAWRVGGAALLAWVAVAHLRPLEDRTEAGAAAARGAAFCAGFCTAATNPLTIAFFAAQAAAGPFGGAAGSALVIAAVGGIAAMALGFYLGMAALMASPVARRAALRWQRPVRLVSAGALMMSAAAVLRPVFPG